MVQEEVHPKQTEERQPIAGQERSAGEELPASVSEGSVSRLQAAPATLPSVAPPTPPGGSLTARRGHLPSGGRWALSMSLVVLGGLSWFFLGIVVGYAPTILFAILVATLPAVTCLVSGWLLRSWRGLVAAAVVYLAVSALIWVWFVAGAGQLPIELVWFVVLPAVVMSAIGTAIGMGRAR